MTGKLICRLCLATDGIMEEIFTSSDINLSQKIFDCTNVEVKNIAGLPKCICEICKSELIIWYKFKRQCLKSNEILKTKFPELFILSNSDFDKDENSTRNDENSNLEIYVDEENQINEKNSEEEQFFVVDVFENEEDFNTVSTLKIEKVQDIISIEDEFPKPEEEEEHLEHYEIDNDKEDNTIETNIIIKPSANRKGGGKKNGKYDNSIVKIIDGDRVRYHRICKICGKLQQNIKQHMLIHTDYKPFKCSYCDKAFRQRTNYKHHIYTHTGEKPYKCKLCVRKFSDPASLRAHMVGHTGERRYRCDTCGNAYGHSHTLAAHQRIHTQDKRHMCELCEKRFLSKHALDKHIRTHTGEKPYKCGFCTKAFSTSGNLSAHKRVHTKEKPYQCTICRQSFGYRCVLKTHMKVHQKNNTNSIDEENCTSDI